MTIPANRAALRQFEGIAPPARPEGAAWALFLDFDGTLIDIAMTPDSVVVPPKLRGILAACIEAFGGAVAIVSGRPISTLDALLDPLKLPAAGLHGLELRMPDGTVEEAAHRTSGLAGLRARFRALAREDARLVVEDKGSSLALHFRRAPERERELRELVAGVATPHDSHHVMHGKMVLEVRPAHADKGSAIARFLETSPFAGRKPVFAGDDITDEDGFAVVNRHGGISIKVGAGESAAACRVLDVASLHDWLAGIARARGGD
ncbi:MAG: trehalose-phosphatase [Gammaproteobacteria bacterium]|nr:trehalose-phosphatase [Gammaproteobacteria bacterium]